MKQTTANHNQEGFNLSNERAQKILDERARKLAVDRESDRDDADGGLEVATFTLAGETYAIETPYVQEIIRAGLITPVPGTPDFVAGVTNLRGTILAIFDVQNLLGLPADRKRKFSHIFVLGRERAEFGILADTDGQINRFVPGEILDPPDTVTSIGRDYIRGVTRNAMVLLNGEVMLRDARLFINQGEESDSS